MCEGGRRGGRRLRRQLAREQPLHATVELAIAAGTLHQLLHELLVLLGDHPLDLLDQVGGRRAVDIHGLLRHDGVHAVRLALEDGVLGEGLELIWQQDCRQLATGRTSRDRSSLHRDYALGRARAREAIESFEGIARGKGGYWEDRGYEWYAGI